MRLTPPTHRTFKISFFFGVVSAALFFMQLFFLAGIFAFLAFALLAAGCYFKKF